MSGPPPVLPPKPGSHEPSRHASPATLMTPSADTLVSDSPTVAEMEGSDVDRFSDIPPFLLNKSAQSLLDLAKDSWAIDQITQATSTIRRTDAIHRQELHTLLSENITLAQQLLDLEAKLSHDRDAAAAHLMKAKRLEHEFHLKEREVDQALEPMMPPALYKRLAQGVVEQQAVCEALEESFLEGGGGEDMATERETMEWIKRYKEAKTVYWRRKEQRDRWDEGRVGGWR